METRKYNLNAFVIITPMNENIKMVLLGATSSGKTSIVYRLVNDRFSETSESTIGASFVVLKYDNVKYQVWDTAGQERYSSLIPMYYRDSDLIVLVYDLNSLISVEKIDFYLNKIVFPVANLREDYKILIIGNKLDLVDSDAITSSKVLINEYIKKYTNIQHRIQFINISTKCGINFDELGFKLQEIGNNILATKNVIPSNSDTNKNIINLGVFDTISDTKYLDNCPC